MAKESKERSSVPQEKLDLYDRLIGTMTGVERKGAAVPYTSHNGHMFSLMDEQGTLGLRLPKDGIGTFLKKYKSTLREAYGIVQKEYVVVPDALLRKTKDLQPWFRMSFEYVSALKPKPSKKK